MVMKLKMGTRPPWVGLGAAIWVQIASGVAYTFPLYSHSLKSVLGFNQRQLTMLGVANDIGENVGLLPGIACNNFPPWVVLSIGAFCCFFGYGVLWLAFCRTLLSLPYWLLWLALVVGANSSAWLSTAVLVINMRNFPISRGTVAGILKGYSGLSAAVYTEIYSVILHSSSPNLLLFLALGVPILCFLVMYLVRPCTPTARESSAESSHFVFIQVASILVGIYLLSTTILGDVLSFSRLVSYIILTIMIAFLMAPLMIPVKMTLFPSNPINTGMDGHERGSSTSCIEDEKTEPLLTPTSSAEQLDSLHENDDSSDVDLLLAEGEGGIKKKRKPKRGEDFTFREAFIKADFWLLFVVYFVGVGSGVTVLNNLGQIGIAYGMPDAKILLSLFSFFNFVGRLGGGSVSEYFVRTRTLPRTICLTFTQSVMIIVYLLFAWGANGTLYAATGMLGLCYGVQFSIMIPTASELFGLKHFGIIFNFMSLGNPLGALLFSGLLAGYIYDHEVSKQHALNMLSANSHTCFGPNCFRITFLVLACICGVGSVLSVILTIRIKPVYQMLYASGSFRQPQTLRKSRPLIHLIKHNNGDGSHLRGFSTRSEPCIGSSSSFQGYGSKFEGGEPSLGLLRWLSSGLVVGSTFGFCCWTDSTALGGPALVAFADDGVANNDNSEVQEAVPEKKPKYLFKDEYRKRVFFNYEKRMRLRSPPEKVFEYFASVRSSSGEYLMTPGT
ncbi:Protein NUCLEAR FUSION DEFECTIVE 4 [Bienertia sinuspersici]